MWKPFEPGSSPVDWCEGNYNISPSIAEFMNTLSNILFLLLPPVLMHLFKDYGRFVNPAIHVIWFMLMIVGVSSAYFHATLSLIGQLLDELAILWVYMAGLCVFFPRRYFPTVFRNDRKIFSVIVILPTIIATGLALIHPAINAFALMCLGIPAFGIMIVELKRTKSMRVYRLGLRCGAVWVVAVACWLNDRLFCDTWMNLNFPYLHALWHLFIFIASYTAAVLFAYFSVKEEKPQQSPVLKYWPRNDFELGIPLISDLKAFERRLTEVISSLQPSTLRWRILLGIISICTAVGAWHWLTDPNTSAVSFTQSLYNHPVFALASILLVILFMLGVHRRVIAPSIITQRARNVLGDFNMSCDDTGKLILKPTRPQHPHET